jgi:carboxyl-terminal processing protease
VFVPADTTEGSGYLSELYFSGALNQFAFDVADRDRERLKRYGSAETFNTEYVVGPEMLQRLRTYAEGQGVRSPAPGSERTKRAVAMRLKAGIARNVWGSEAFYAIMLDADSAFQKARASVVKP